MNTALENQSIPGSAHDPSVETLSIDMQIHRDVFSAEDNIMKEVNDILVKAIAMKSAVQDTKKIETLNRLRELGFGSSQEVAEASEIEEKIKAAQEKKEKIEYYRRTYPLNKFIDHESVKKICDKYGLLLASSGDYIAEIPDKNKLEIINFRVYPADIRFPAEVFGWRATRFERISIRRADRRRRLGLPAITPIENSNEKIPGKDLLIVAPPHKLDLSNRRVSGHTVVMKDPIVLMAVAFGFLIVSAWGFEAEDELIMNPIQN